MKKAYKDIYTVLQGNIPKTEFVDTMIEYSRLEVDNLEFLLSSLYHSFSHLGILTQVILGNNEYMEKALNIEENNPLQLSRKEINQQFQYIFNGSKLERLCYVLLFSNRAAKLSEVGSQRILRKVEPNIYKQSYPRKKLMQLRQTLIQENLIDDFIEKEQDLSDHNITSKEFKQDKTIVEVKNILKQSKKYININLHDLYKYIAFECARDNLYKIKDHLIIDIMKLYKNNKDFKIDIVEDLRNKYNVSIIISIPNYSVPFQYHFKKQHIEQILKENEIGIEITRETKQKKFFAIWPRKLSEEQINCISQMEMHTLEGSQIQDFVRENRQENPKKNITKPQIKTNKIFKSKMLAKDREFAKWCIKTSSLNCKEQHEIELAKNSQPTYLSTRYKKMEEYFKNNWKQEEKDYSEEEQEKELSKAFVYLKLGRGGIYNLAQNLPNVYEEYKDGFNWVQEAINNNEPNIRAFVREKKKQSLKEKKVQEIQDLANKISKKQEELKETKEKSKQLASELQNLKSELKGTIEK